MENMLMQFMETSQASFKANQNSIQNLEIQVGESYSMENCCWEQELQPYNQYEEERISNLENVLMQFMETSEANQHAFQNLEIQVGKLAKEVAELPFLVTKEENFVEVEVHEESLVEEHDSREKYDEKKRHGERDKSLSVILSLITNTSLAMMWKAFLGYMSFMESLAKRRKCKEDVFYVIFMPP
ncbi:hypothetical protein JHK82_028195 [Glycine max]|nr:hypothetical protein JHK85_028861 [Glycine max]KAG5004180.1 hypothetical protein JHK86_028319 [Glycine max]KAG5127360.1 hypothetical protein JHK82_028195 [Glycine max]KAG5151974.1 hypothetical protein JHK84_028446 [Glycine max]KHN16054.1 hypothetical protein glysoja_012030 [Glycine soja]